MAARTIGIISDDIFKIDEQISKLKRQIEALEDKKKPLQLELKNLADKQGLKSGKGSKSAFSITEQTVPQVKDWDEFWGFIHKTRYFHLLYKRPAVKACAELWELGRAIPGVEKFSQIKVNVKGV